MRRSPVPVPGLRFDRPARSFQRRQLLLQLEENVAAELGNE